MFHPLRCSSLSLLLSLLLVGFSIHPVDSFTVVVRGGPSFQRYRALYLAKETNDDDDAESSSNNKGEQQPQQPFDLDTFLDTPFFDPESVDETTPAWLRSLAAFVRKDYATAELVLSGSFIALMILASQELVRMQLYGDQYTAFQGGVRNGGLF